MLESGQQLLISGSILHLARYNTDGTLGPARDIGTIEVLNPSLGTTKAMLFDSRCGRRIKVSERTTEYSETADVLTPNISLENLVYIFGGDSVQTYTQAATPLVAVPHLLFPDSLCHLHDLSGNYFYNIASIQSVGSLVASADNGLTGDYLVNADLLRVGCIKMLPTSTVADSPSGVSTNISFTPSSITGKRFFNPQSSGTVKCRAWIFWNADNCATVMLRDTVDVMITAQPSEFKDTDYSKVKFTMDVLVNSASSVQPSGRFIQTLGALPPRTF